MVKGLRKSLILSCVLALFLPSVASADMNVSRIAGANRYETALTVSKTTFNDAEYVIIASGEKYPDAVFGGSIASQTKSPILLVGRDNIPTGVINEIKRLNPKNILLLGGESTISEYVLSKIQMETVTPVRRIYGKNRIETADEINNFRDEYINLDEMGEVPLTRHYFIAVNAYNFYDALYSSPYFGLIGVDFDENTRLNLYLCAANPVVEDYDYGGVIGDIKVNNYEGYMNITRGRNRYEASTKIADRFKKYVNKDMNTIIITSGEDYPDGLSSSGLVGTKLAPIVLTPNNSVDKYVKSFIQKNNIQNVIIVGGEKSVSKNVENELRGL